MAQAVVFFCAIFAYFAAVHPENVAIHPKYTPNTP